MHCDDDGDGDALVSLVVIMMVLGEHGGSDDSSRTALSLPSPPLAPPGRQAGSGHHSLPTHDSRTNIYPPILCRTNIFIIHATHTHTDEPIALCQTLMSRSSQFPYFWYLVIACHRRLCVKNVLAARHSCARVACDTTRQHGSTGHGHCT